MGGAMIFGAACRQSSPAQPTLARIANSAAVASRAHNRARTSLMPFRLIVLLLALIGGVVAQESGARASSGQILSACAAFAPDGTSATVSVGADSFVLEITEPSGKLTRLSQPLRRPVTPAKPAASTYPTCEDYFDRNSGLVAVGIGRRFFEDQLQVAVADLRTSLKWIGDWGVGLESGFHPSLAGFLE